MKSLISESVNIVYSPTASGTVTGTGLRHRTTFHKREIINIRDRSMNIYSRSSPNRRNPLVKIHAVLRIHVTKSKVITIGQILTMYVQPWLFPCDRTLGAMGAVCLWARVEKRRV